MQGIPEHMILWCNLCNAAPAEGKLDVIDDNGMELTLDACTNCVIRIPKKNWITK